MFCEKCGQQLREGASFCGICGHRIVQEDSSENLNESFLQPDDTISSESEPDSKTIYENTKQKKGFPLRICVLIGFAVVLIAGAVVLFLILFNNHAETAPKKEFKELESVEELPGDFEKDLGLFYYYISKDRNADGTLDFEGRHIFDCNDPDTYHDYMIEALMPFITPVRLSSYPGEITEDVEKGPDPLNKYDGAAFCRVPKDKIIWITENIFHIPHDEIEDMIRYACDNTDIYQYEEKGKEYLINKYLGIDTYNCDKEYQRILTDGEKYYLLIEYSYEKYTGLPTETYYVEAGYENIDGQSYWTLYRHALEAPDFMYQSLDELNGTVESASAAAPTEEAKKIVDVDPSELPDSLKNFLVLINYGLHTDDNSKYHHEFDSSNLESCYDTLVGCIATHGSCVNLTDYPYYDYKEDWTAKSDPLGKIEKMGYVSFTKEQIVWVLKNIFHIADESIDGLFEAAYSSEQYLYEYEDDGTIRLYNWLSGIGGSLNTVAYEDVRFDGERYYIVYDHFFDGYKKDAEAQVYYAEVSEIEFEGRKYWTLYKNTEKIPELQELTEEFDNSSVFALFEGGYTFCSGVGFWSSHIELHTDGTFTGEYHDSNMGESGDGYDATIYQSEFSGRFVNPKKINAYTYSFELDEIVYKNEVGKEEIESLGNNVRRRIVYSEAYGLNHGTKTIYAYTSDAPVSVLPEGFMSWVGHLRGDNKYKSNLVNKCLYAVEPEFGWIGPKEE